MRIFKLNAALLALIFSVIAEVLFFFIDRAFGEITQFGTPLNFIGWLGFWFHILPSAYFGKLGDSPLALPAWLFQWWIIFFPTILFARCIVRQNNPKLLKVAVGLLSVALIISLGFLVNSQLWQYYNWKGMVNSLASIQGYEQAEKDFNDGKLKVFIISGECEQDKYSGTNDGPFQVWTAEYFPSLPYAGRYSDEMKIKAYNLHMRGKYKWSLTHTNSTKLLSTP